MSKLNRIFSTVFALLLMLFAASCAYPNDIEEEESPKELGTYQSDTFGDSFGSAETTKKDCATDGHTFVDWTVEKYADEEAEGSKYAYCSVCGVMTRQGFKCSKGLEYRSNGDGTCSVIGIGTCKDTDVVIPTTYNGEAVTAIGSSAFSSKETLNSVIMPQGMTEIGSHAFAWSSKLQYVVIPESVTKIDAGTFWYCYDMTFLRLPSQISFIGDGALNCAGFESIDDFVLSPANPYYHVSGNCIIETESKKLMVGFGDCVIPNDGSVTSIAGNAFAGCDSLTSLVIPSNVKSIGGSAFYCCGNLTSITFSEGLESIGYNAFNACHSLKSITIPNSLTVIGSAAFTWCSGIGSVVIGSGVTNIYSDAFNQCTSLKDIHYVGTKDEWDRINKEDGWASNAGAFTVHYNYSN